MTIAPRYLRLASRTGAFYSSIFGKRGIQALGVQLRATEGSSRAPSFQCGHLPDSAGIVRHRRPREGGSRSWIDSRCRGGSVSQDVGRHRDGDGEGSPLACSRPTQGLS